MSSTAQVVGFLLAIGLPSSIALAGVLVTYRRIADLRNHLDARVVRTRELLDLR